MEQEILIEDGIGGEHRVKYLDESRVSVQTVIRYVSAPSTEDHISYSMPAKVKVLNVDDWPFTEELKIQIENFHAQFPDAE